MFKAYFMTSTMQSRYAKTVVVSERIKVNVKEQLSPLGVVYKTKTVLRILLGLQTIHSLRFARIILF